MAGGKGAIANIGGIAQYSEIGVFPLYRLPQRVDRVILAG